MRYLRATWSTVSIPPKLHMLEDHALEFFREWGVGFGFYGEQGGESIHAEFNSLYRTYCGMKPIRLWVLSMLKEHHRCVHPLAKALKPTKVTKKRKT